MGGFRSLFASALVLTLFLPVSDGLTALRFEGVDNQFYSIDFRVSEPGTLFLKVSQAPSNYTTFTALFLIHHLDTGNVTGVAVTSHGGVASVATTGLQPVRVAVDENALYLACVVLEELEDFECRSRASYTDTLAPGRYRVVIAVGSDGATPFEAVLELPGDVTRAVAGRSFHAREFDFQGFAGASVTGYYHTPSFASYENHRLETATTGTTYALLYGTAPDHSEFSYEGSAGSMTAVNPLWILGAPGGQHTFSIDKLSGASLTSAMAVLLLVDVPNQ